MIWLNIDGYDGSYQISEDGIIRRILDDNSERVIKPCKASNGSAYVTLWKNNIRKVYMLHNLYAETFQVPVEDAICIIYEKEGLGGKAKAKNNLRRWILERMRACEEEMRRGENMSIEIVYLKSFLKQL